MRKAWEWVKARAAWVGAGLLAFFVFFFGWLWNRRPTPTLGDLQTARRKLSMLDGVRSAVVERVGETDEAIVQIDKERLEHKRTILAERQAVEELSDAEVAEAFRKLYPNRD